MNPVVMSLEGLLALLLLATLVFGIKLERKLKALRQSQAGFASAVRDLDSAAARTEAGLDALRMATDGARDVLVQRMEAAQQMSLRLEALTQDAEAAARKADIAAKSVDLTAERAAATVQAAAAAARAQAEAEAAAALSALPPPVATIHRLPEPQRAAPMAQQPAEPVVNSRLREAAALLRGGRR